MRDNVNPSCYIVMHWNFIRIYRRSWEEEAPLGETHINLRVTRSFLEHKVLPSSPDFKSSFLKQDHEGMHELCVAKLMKSPLFSSIWSSMNRVLIFFHFGFNHLQNISYQLYIINVYKLIISSISIRI